MLLLDSTALVDVQRSHGLAAWRRPCSPAARVDSAAPLRPGIAQQSHHTLYDAFRASTYPLFTVIDFAAVLNKETAAACACVNARHCCNKGPANVPDGQGSACA